MKKIKKRKSKKIKKSDSIITDDLEKFYKIVNNIQINKEVSKIFVKVEDSFHYENIIKDLDLIIKYKHKRFIEDKDVYEYEIHPSNKEVKDEIDFDNMENIPDEFFEDGQLFGI